MGSFQKLIDWLIDWLIHSFIKSIKLLSAEWLWQRSTRWRRSRRRCTTWKSARRARSTEPINWIRSSLSTEPSAKRYQRPWSDAEAENSGKPFGSPRLPSWWEGACCPLPRNPQRPPPPPQISLILTAMRILFLTKFYYCRMWGIFFLLPKKDFYTNLAENSKSCGQILMKFCRAVGCLTSKKPFVLALILITIRIPEFSTEFLPLRIGAMSSKNFVGSSALEQVCCLQVLLILVLYNTMSV